MDDDWDASSSDDGASGLMDWILGTGDTKDLVSEAVNIFVQQIVLEKAPRPAAPQPFFTSKMSGAEWTKDP